MAGDEGRQGGTASGAGPEPLVLEIQTRFLYPFFFDRRKAREAGGALSAAAIVGRKGAWECAEPPVFYREEFLATVVQYLFADASPQGCGYLKLSNAAANAVFHGTSVRLSRESSLPVRFLATPGIELFLTDHGAGVLSIALAPPERLSLAQAADFDYRLAQLRRSTVAEFRVPHPEDDPAALARIPEADRARIPKRPAADAPLAQRLGARGGTFTMIELLDALLEPLKPLGLLPIQHELSAYAVARFDASVDFADLRTREVLGPFLAKLAQIEEPLHAGAVPDDLGVENALMNRRHWAGAGLLGAAHLVADQAPPPGLPAHPYDPMRLPRVRDKYFVPYLAALLQRLVTQRAADEASSTLLQGVGTAGSAGAIASLRHDLLEFAGVARFSHVSHREAVHRWYRLARAALDVDDAAEAARRALADLDATEAGDRQEEVAKGMAGSLRYMARVQSVVEWIEVVLISVYAAHFWEMFDPLAHGGHAGPHWDVLLVTVASAAGALALIRPWKHDGHA